MKKSITMLLITIVTIVALPYSVKASNAKETDHKVEISKSWGSDPGTPSVQTVVAQDTRMQNAVEMSRNWEGGYGTTSVQPATARDATGMERTAETAKNWGGLCD